MPAPRPRHSCKIVARAMPAHTRATFLLPQGFDTGVSIPSSSTVHPRKKQFEGVISRFCSVIIGLIRRRDQQLLEQCRPLSTVPGTLDARALRVRPRRGLLRQRGGGRRRSRRPLHRTLDAEAWDASPGARSAVAAAAAAASPPRRRRVTGAAEGVRVLRNSPLVLPSATRVYKSCFSLTHQLAF
eukprot:gene24325-biopygen22386